MIIKCPECEAKYKYSEEKFEGAKTKKVRCSKCKNTFQIVNPDYEEETDESSGASVSSTQKIEMNDKNISPSEAARRDVLMLPPNKKLSLAVIEGSDSGEIFNIEKPSSTIGRAETDFVINDQDVSRQHALVEIRGNKYVIKDLDSTNGTYVDDKEIKEEEISNQTEIRVGTTTLIFIESDK